MSTKVYRVDQWTAGPHNTRQMISSVILDREEAMIHGQRLASSIQGTGLSTKPWSVDVYEAVVDAASHVTAMPVNGEYLYRIKG